MVGAWLRWKMQLKMEEKRNAQMSFARHAQALFKLHKRRSMTREAPILIYGEIPMTLGWDAPRGNRAQSGPVADADTPEALAAAAADAAVAAARRALPARAKRVFRDKVELVDGVY